MTEEHAKYYVEALKSKIMDTPVDPDLKKLDKEVIPIIAELFTVQPGNHDHPANKDFFNWLVNPQRTGREILYAIANLEDDVYEIMIGLFEDYVGVRYNDSGYINGSYLGKIAIEALAVICPILEGHWESIAWIVIMVHIGSGYDKGIYGTASKRLSSWLIHIISDPDLCPNENLRFRFMPLLCLMIDLSDFDKEQALESVLSACSMINFKNRYIPLEIITDTFTMLAKGKFLMKYGDKFAGELLDMKGSAVKPFNYPQPIAFKAINVLLKYLSQRARLAIARDFKKGSKLNIDTESDEVLPLYKILITYFRKSLQTPPLDTLISLYEKDMKNLHSKTGFLVRRIDAFYS